jgi:uncharacterized protein (UPF0332 family)
MNGSQRDYFQYRIDRSAELFQDAKLLAANKRWRSCVNRLYYSSFHLVSALLALDGITTKSHDGLKTKFLQSYVKTNLIDIEFGKLYARLLDWRQESDYSVYLDFNEEDVMPLIQKIGKLNQVLKELIQSRI